MASARFRHVTIDCPAPVALARFYAQLLGLHVEPLGDIKEEDVTWLRIVNDAGEPIMGFAKVKNYVAPTWPEGPVPQQLHVELSVADMPTAEREALALGARKSEFQTEETCQVFFDPVGHPFCLILNYND